MTLEPCGCGGPDPLPERDTSKPAEAQGLFRKFNVSRTDGSSAPGGKHAGCEYFVLDVDHDPHAKAALAAYALAVGATHPALAADMVARYELEHAPPITAVPPQWEAKDGVEWYDHRYGFHISFDLDDDGPYGASWGEGDTERFATLAEAQAWCQSEVDGWVRRNAVVRS
jgi:hypothetical protein